MEGLRLLGRITGSLGCGVCLDKDLGFRVAVWTASRVVEHSG